MNQQRMKPVVSDFRFEASRLRPRSNTTPRPLAKSATTSPTGHCQSRRGRTETNLSRNAAASLTLLRAKPVSVPKSAPVGGLFVTASRD
jgi:hypothetical protein